MEGDRPRRVAGVEARRAVSLLELVLAAALILAATLPLYDAFFALRKGIVQTEQRTTALYLGQAVLENVRNILYRDGAGSGDPEAMQRFFEALAEEGASVVSTKDGATSLHFAQVENTGGTGLHGITEATHPHLADKLRGFRYRLAVRSGAPETDADGDGAPDPGLAELEVTIAWIDGGGRPRTATLWTILTGRRHGGI